MPGFIKNTDGHFEADGKRLRFVGCNMYELAFMDKPVADRMLEDAKDEGYKVVRLWAFAPLRPEKLVEVCETAGKLGLRLIPVLCDKWGYMQDYVIDDEWFREGYKKDYLGYAVNITAALKDRQEIIIWELINEPESDSFEVFYDFIQHTSSEVKKVNDNHLLSVGTIGGLGSKYGGQFSRFSTKNYEKLFSLEELDALSVHDYSFDATMLERMDTLYRFQGKYYTAKAFERANFYVTYLPMLFKRFWLKKFRPFTFPLSLKWLWRKYISKNISIARKLKKPFYLGEIGYKNNLNMDRKKIIDEEIRKYFEKGIDGFILWSFEAQGWSKDGHNYGFNKEDGFKDIIQKWNKELN